MIAPLSRVQLEVRMRQNHKRPETSVSRGVRLRPVGAIAMGAALLLQLFGAGAAGAADTGTSVGQVAAVQNQVETKRANETSWSASTLHQALYGLDRVRTGPASRAAILYSDRTVQRLNEKSEIEIQAPGAGQPGILKVLSGTAYFSSRSPKDYGRIETPTVTAAIKGT